MSLLTRILGAALVTFVWQSGWAIEPIEIPLHFLRLPDPGVQPQAVVDAAGTVHVVYLGGDAHPSDVYYIQLAAGQTNYSKPLRVNSQAGSAVAMGAVRGAQLTLGQSETVHVVWNGSSRTVSKPGDGAGMFYSRLRTSGTFEPQRNLMTSTTGLDGGGSVTADTNGNIFVVWHGRKKGDSSGEEHRAVFITQSTNNGITFSTERRANSDNTGACGCCALKAYAHPNGTLGIVYRSADTNGQRDTILLLSEDGGWTFRSKTLGVWKLSSCPMSTQALGRGLNDTMRAMWESQGQIYSAAVDLDDSTPHAECMDPDRRSDTRKYPAFATSTAKGNRFVVVWTEGVKMGKGGDLHWEYFDASRHIADSGQLKGVGPWNFATVVPAKDGSFLVIY